jgi:hypothetical protein
LYTQRSIAKRLFKGEASLPTGYGIEPKVNFHLSDKKIKKMTKFITDSIDKIALPDLSKLPSVKMGNGGGGGAEQIIILKLF